MDAFSALRTLGGLLTVLGLLAGGLWVVRRFNLSLPAGNGRPQRRLEVVERLGLDPRRSVILLRCDDREHLVLLGPEGPLLIDGKVRAAPPRHPGFDSPPPPRPFALRGTFAGLVERARHASSKATQGAASE